MLYVLYGTYKRRMKQGHDFLRIMCMAPSSCTAVLPPPHAQMAANAPAAAAPPVATACPNSFAYENPVCVNNGTLHIGDRVADELSCSYCDCEEGWEGVDCGRCSTVSACPDITLNGTVRGCK